MPSASIVVRNSALSLLLSTGLFGQQPAPGQAGTPSSVVALATAPGRSNVLLDEPGDGRIWARGRDWKASFGRDGFTFVPFLGADAPANAPLSLQLVAVQCGDRALRVPTDTAPHRGESRVQFARGDLVEVYDLRPEHVEQSFVVPDRPGQGDLVLTMALRTDLQASPCGDGGFRFGNERGGVAVGAAIAIDAAGVRTPVRAEVAHGHYVLTVPAACVASAAYPLVVDPLLQAFTLTTAGLTTPVRSPDIAYTIATGGLYVAVYEERFSATDSDVLFRLVRPDGSSIVENYIDPSQVSWVTPRIASHAGTNQLLCVARREGLDIAARPIDISGPIGFPVLAAGNQFQVKASATAVDPDVGGDADPAAASPGHYCVTWSDGGLVQWTIVRTDGLVVTPGGNTASSLLAFASHPTLSKSCGTPAAGTQEWILVFEQSAGVGNQNIYGRRIGKNGSYNSPRFAIDTSPWSDTRPQVSSVTDAVGSGSHWLCVWQRRYPQTTLQNEHVDLLASVHGGSTSWTGIVDLSSLLLRPQGYLTNPAVDTDGTRFVVAWSEQASIFTPDVEPYAATVHLAGSSSLGVTSYAELLNVGAAADDHLQVASERSGGGAPSDRYALAWDVTQAVPFVQTAVAAFFLGHADAPPSPYFNNALPGCGAIQLVGSGVPSLGSTFRLDLTQFQGAPWLLIGESVAPIAICPQCELGIDPATFLLVPTSGIALTVPQDTALIGAQLGCQGADLYVPGGCAADVLGFEFTLSNELIVTVL